MTPVRPLSPDLREPPAVIGAKAHGLAVMMRLALPVPPGFVLGTDACRESLRDGRLPAGFGDALRGLESATGRVLGDAERPLLVSVRSGAAVSMPGMMTTVLDVDRTSVLVDAVRTVFGSWHSPRATTYREIHGIPHDGGTAVIVQAMVSGHRDRHSAAGVAFSRDPRSGAPQPFGEVVFGRSGDAVVSGRAGTLPLAALAERIPGAAEALAAALDRLERHYRDACQVEFTVESGRLWLLQVRPGGYTGRAAVRVAVDLAEEQLIDRDTALDRITPAAVRAARVPRLTGTAVLTRGQGASPGVASGRIAVTADRAAVMAADGPVILVRPHTSPLDMHGLAAAAGVLTVLGGPACHAAVVARSMGRPAVVGAGAVTVDEAAGRIRVGERVLPEGTVITVDGTGGEVVLGHAEATTAEDPHLTRLLEWDRVRRAPPRS
ncbi:PEP/pyruvate-binding domain-containing protein [Actinoplanes rectilineatus]|uniref:PEP/pyruvate-binding domain-containing protein n=1 Tax=Actinoplanes rectilineatus TaxID=113571 RepID=UPI0006975B96|nr:PEP/pyruvate-binding domain-containing protein [Actinoplanes rectilineatus]